MISPKYRNAIYPTMGKINKIKFKVRINNVSDFSGAKLSITLSRNNSPIKTWQFISLKKGMILSLDVDSIIFQYTRSSPYAKDDNPYWFDFQFKKGALLASVSVPLNKYPPPPSGIREVRLDDNDNLLIDGQRVFIFGAYLEDHNLDTWSYLEKLGFNGFIEWVTHLNNNSASWGMIETWQGQPENLDLVRNNIRQYRKHPRLLGYNLLDEPMSSWSYVNPDTVAEHYNIAKEEDPYHISAVSYFITTYGPGYTHWSIKDYKAPDLILLDPYPINKDNSLVDLRTVYYNYELIRNSDSNYSSFEQEDAAIWGVLQMFGGGQWRFPKKNELKNMAFQHIAGGAKGLFLYAYRGTFQDMWEYFSSEIMNDINSLGEGKFAPEVTNSIQVQSSDGDRLVWAHRQTADEDYIFLINTTSQWNTDYKNKNISIAITFNEKGGDELIPLVYDSMTSSVYTITNNKVFIDLPGVTDNSAGVLVLSRSRKVLGNFNKADLNEDGSVDFQDLIALFRNWGDNPANPGADIVTNGKVDFQDLIELFRNWGQ